MTIWERNSHQFYKRGNEASSKGFSLPDKSEEGVLREAHEFYKDLFKKEDDLQSSRPLLSTVRCAGTGIPTITFNEGIIIEVIDSLS